jgi:hypothetical protein
MRIIPRRFSVFVLNVRTLGNQNMGHLTYGNDFSSRLQIPAFPALTGWQIYSCCLSPNTLVTSLHVPGRSLELRVSAYAVGSYYAEEGRLPKTSAILQVRGRGTGINLRCEKKVSIRMVLRWVTEMKALLS